MMIYFLYFSICLFILLTSVVYYETTCYDCGSAMIIGMNCTNPDCPGKNQRTKNSSINSHASTFRPAFHHKFPHTHTGFCVTFATHQKRSISQQSLKPNKNQKKGSEEHQPSKTKDHQFNKTNSKQKRAGKIESKAPEQPKSNKILLFNKLSTSPGKKIFISSKSIAPAVKANKTVPSKIVGESKHFPPANKEWLNSVYSYNKNSLRSLPGKDFIARKLIKNYFNLSADKSLARSKRKRIRIRKSSLNRLFVSRPEVKQTNDKVILNVYTYDRQRQSLLRKLYLNIVRWERWQLGKKIYIKRPVWKKGKWVQKVWKVYREKPKLIFFKKYNRWRKKRIHKFSAENLSKKLVLARSKKLALAEYKKLAVARSNKPFYETPITSPSNEKTPKNNLLRIAPNLERKKNNTEKAEKHYKKLKIKYKLRLAKAARSAKLTEFARSNKQVKKLKKSKHISWRINTKLFSFKSQIRPKTKFIPKRITYTYKPFLKGTWRKKSYKRFLRKRFKMFNPNGKRKSLMINKKIPYFGLKHTNFMKFVSYIFNNKKFKIAKNMMLVYCNWYILSLFNIKMWSFQENWDIKRKKFRKLKKTNKLNKFISTVEFQKPLKGQKIRFKKFLPYYIRRFLKLKHLFKPKRRITFELGKVTQKVKMKHFTYKNFNYLILKLVMKILIKNNLKLKLEDIIYKYSANSFLNFFFKSLFSARTKKEKKKRYKGIKYKRFHKKALIINYALKLIINKSKFGSLLVGLKTLISKIYNKKVELNIVNLKYPHLNADIFSQAVAARLKKRASLLKVMRRSIQLAKLPKRFKEKDAKHSVNKFGVLSYYKSLKFENLHNDSIEDKRLTLFAFNGKNIFQKTLNALYSHSLVNQPKILKDKNNKLNNLRAPLKKKNSILNKTTSVLNTIKYKWATGVRLEAAGRLTRRYTAAKSIFKFRRKGSLQNVDYSKRSKYIKATMPNVIFRNLLKSNAQYSFVNGKRRVGAYGIKTWMASY